MACAGQEGNNIQNVVVKNAPDGISTSFKGDKVDGETNKRNDTYLTPDQCKIAGKNVQKVEWTKMDSAKFLGTVLVGITVGIVFPPALALIGIAAVKGRDDKEEKIAESQKADFFNEDLRDQYDERFSQTYSEAQNYYNTCYNKWDSSNNRLGEVKNELKNWDKLTPDERNALRDEKSSLENTISKMSVEMNGLAPKLLIMEKACTAIKTADTKNPISLEVFKTFDDFKPGVFRDVTGSQGLMNFFSNQYSNSSFLSSRQEEINPRLDNLNSLNEKLGEIDGKVGLTIDNMNVLAAKEVICRIAGNDINPRETFSASMNMQAEAANTAVGHLAGAVTQDEASSLKSGDIPPMILDNLDNSLRNEIIKEAKDINKSYDAGIERMEKIQNKIDNQSHHKNTSNNSGNNNQQKQINQQNQINNNLQQQQINNSIT